jgi:DNA (cytosine-5)-methyltransferase 1
MRTLDLFAGCGGMSLGFEKAGFDVVAAIDNWEVALATYRANFTTPTYDLDLSDPAPFYAFFQSFKPDVIIGGPPCQDFSSAGKRDETLGRADLTLAFTNIIQHVQPQYFVMENVNRIQKSPIFRQAKALLEISGYGLSEIVLDASLCGVPQLRKRLFLIGVKGERNQAVIPYLTQHFAPSPLTVRDYLGDKLTTDYYYRHPRSYKRRGIFSVDEPSPTIRGVNRPIPKGYPGHSGDPVPLSEEVRPLTTRERSWIQTFPEDFQLIGTKADVEQMLGNAVPVKLAEYVANALKEYASARENGTPRLELVEQLALF